MNISLAWFLQQFLKAFTCAELRPYIDPAVGGITQPMNDYYRSSVLFLWLVQEGFWIQLQVDHCRICPD